MVLCDQRVVSHHVQLVAWSCVHSRAYLALGRSQAILPLVQPLEPHPS